MDRFLEMQTFAAVVDAGSFVAAAEGLGHSKAAVSRRVADLEARLGSRLLHRTTRRLSLTPEGEVFLSRCRELLSDLEEAEAEIASRSGQAAGLLRLNAPVTFGIRRLAPLWAMFRDRHRKVRLDITLSDRLVDLVEEGYDMAIRIGALRSSSLIARKLADTRLVVCASPAYLEAHGTPSTPEEIADHAVIGYSYWSAGEEWRLEGPGGTVTVRTNPIIHSNNGDTCREVAVAGQGIILQPEFVVGDDISTGRLVELMPDYQAGNLGVYAVYPSRRYMPPKIRALIDFLVEQLSPQAPG